MIKKNETTVEVKADPKVLNELMSAFKTQGVTINPVIPEGEHKAIFKGWSETEFKDDLGLVKYPGYTISLLIDGKAYEHHLRFSATTAENQLKQFNIFKDIFQDIARQFKLDGQVTINDLNAHIGETIYLHVVIKDGKRYTNFYQKKAAPVVNNEVPVA